MITPGQVCIQIGSSKLKLLVSSLKKSSSNVDRDFRECLKAVAVYAQASNIQVFEAFDEMFPELVDN